MPRETQMRALPRPVPALAAFGAILAGCGLPASDDRYRGGGYHGSAGYHSSPGYYGSPSYSHYRPPSHHHHHRGEHHKPRTENWSQERLRQHWLNQAQRPR